MLRLICAGLCAYLIHPTTYSHASTVFRCEDQHGHITYTLQGCPDNASQHLQNAHNSTPGKGAATPLASPANPRNAGAPRNRASRDIVVVGSRQDGCGNRLSDRERRQAVIRQQVRGGMTQRDVENAFGAPDRISSSDGQTRYHYADGKGNRRQVTFDEHGCVKEQKKR